MAALGGVPSVSQLSAGHTAVYEGYYRQADKSGSGKIGASDAATFLKRSNLKEGVLHKIWELSDPQGTAYLDKHRFFLALRLIALAQNGKEVALTNLSLLVPAPNLGEASSILPGAVPVLPTVPPPQEALPWTIKQPEKAKYDGIFEGLKPVNGLLPGDKVKPVLLNSKLPVDVLGCVWDLADIDQDGMLDSDEFAVAMHLVYRALEGDSVPISLPGRLVPPSKRKPKHPSSAPASPAPPMAAPAVLPSPVPADPSWVVSNAERLKSDAMFQQADKDGDGLVSGEEVKSIFMVSGLPQQILAHIWGLCDTINTGRLNSEQFALAIHLIQKKVNGTDPPPALTPDMMPPSMRKTSLGSSEDKESLPGSASPSIGDFSAIKELDKITKEIEDLGREKVGLQHEIEEKEDLIRQRNNDIQKLQIDLEKTKQSVQELEKQKKGAQASLDELDSEKTTYEGMLADLKEKYQEKSKSIANLQLRISNQKKSVLQQEEELSQARTELNKLRESETKLEQQIASSKEYMETVQKQLKSVQTEINQVRSKLSALTETNSSLNANIAHYNSLMNSNSAAPANSCAAVAGGGGGLPGMSDFAPLTDAFEADSMSVRATAGSSPVSSLSGFSVGSGRVEEVDDFKDNDPFKSKENLFGSEAEPNDPFHADDPFKSDPFHKSVSFADPFAGDPFEGEEDLFKTSNDPFKSDLPTSGEPRSGEVANGVSSSLKSDPFSMDPFQSTFPSNTKNTNENFFTSDPFKPSGDSGDSDSKKSSSQQKPSESKDPFNSDPFGSDPFGAS